MKSCKRCGDEIGTRDGENHCKACRTGKRKKADAAARRKAMQEAMESCGLTRVVGAMGGVYYE